MAAMTAGFDLVIRNGLHFAAAPHSCVVRPVNAGGETLGSASVGFTK